MSGAIMKMSKVDSGIVSPIIKAKYLSEPALCFADGVHHVDPKIGILTSGPKSFSPYANHPSLVRVGVIGTAETIDKAMAWIVRGTHGIDGDAEYVQFPGCQKDRGFRSELLFSDDWLAQLTQSEVRAVLNHRTTQQKFDSLLGLLDGKLNILASKDRVPEYVVLALPAELYMQCRTAKSSLHGAQRVHRDLRRAFKSLAMKYRLATQILRQQTIEDETGDVLSKIYWNFFTGLYFKAGGYPWGPVGLTHDTCYMGISFYHPIDAEDSRIRTSLVQAFDENGDGLVLRGPDFIWDVHKHQSRSPHLMPEQAFELTELALARYQSEIGHSPKRVVVHKTSRYWNAEKTGFVEAFSSKVDRFDLVALSAQSSVRLLTTNKYPALRGTLFSVGNIDHLYTTGYIAELGQYHGLHVPAPIYIADHVGQDTSREELAREILILTKMNWNSAVLGGLMPITVRFSRLVGDIMREIPSHQHPLPQYRYYM